MRIHIPLLNDDLAPRASRGERPLSCWMRKSHSQPTREGLKPVYRLPGLSHKAAEHIVEMARQEFEETWHKPVGRPKSLGWLGALRLCLVRLRRNVTFEELGEDFGVAKTVAFGYHHEMTEFLADAIGCSTEDLKRGVKRGKVFLVDGTLIPTWNWRHRKDLFSGKHKRYGVNVQVVADIHGRVEAVSKARPGSWHDKRCHDEAGLDAALDGAGGKVGDSGYQGTGLTTPEKRKPKTELTPRQKRYNKSVSKIRVAVEWAIGHLKNWRIMTTRYRGVINHRLDNTILAVAGLQRLNDLYSTRSLSLERLQRKERVSE